MKKKSLYPVFIFSIFFIIACTSSYQPKSVQYKDYRIVKAIKNDEDLSALIKPYADSVNKSMSDIIAVANVMLEKKQPEGTLGNVLADAMLSIAKENYKTPIDAAVMNYGGIRLPSITAGNITRGKIFELSPFDNMVVLQKLSGKVLQNFLNLTASKGGWPVAGITMQIENKQAINIMIRNAPLDTNNVYTIALLDYVANGGDDADMLRNIPQINNGHIFRESLIEYFSKLNSEGIKISGKIDNRITNAN